MTKKEVLEEFRKTALELCDMKHVHGLSSKSVSKLIDKDVEGSIESFYLHYFQTQEKFDKRDSSVISGTAWMKSKKDLDKLWNLMERCKKLSFEYFVLQNIVNSN